MNKTGAQIAYEVSNPPDYLLMERMSKYKMTTEFLTHLPCGPRIRINFYLHDDRPGIDSPSYYHIIEINQYLRVTTQFIDNF